MQKNTILILFVGVSLVALLYIMSLFSPTQQYSQTEYENMNSQAEQLILPEVTDESSDAEFADAYVEFDASLEGFVPAEGELLELE